MSSPLDPARSTGQRETTLDVHDPAMQTHLPQQLRDVIQQGRRGLFADTNDVVERLQTMTTFLDEHRKAIQPVPTSSGYPA